MPRSVQSLVTAVCALALATSCNPTLPTTPTTPTPLTEAFTALLTTNGAVVFPFAEVTAGTVTATLTTISPDAGLTLSVDLGTWNGANCTIVVTTNPAVQGASVTAMANGAGSLCARVSDANGAVTSTESVTVTVMHF
jgi:hypothetical protein